MISTHIRIKGIQNRKAIWKLVKIAHEIIIILPAVLFISAVSINRIEFRRRDNIIILSSIRHIPPSLQRKDCFARYIMDFFERYWNRFAPATGSVPCTWQLHSRRYTIYIYGIYYIVRIIDQFIHWSITFMCHLPVV